MGANIFLVGGSSEGWYIFEATMYLYTISNIHIEIS